MVIQFLWGCLTVSSGLVGLIFFRFWKSSRDRLFLYFAIAFWILGLNWILLATIHPVSEDVHYIYVLRMAAFLVIVAIVAAGSWVLASLHYYSRVQACMEAGHHNCLPLQVKISG